MEPVRILHVVTYMGRGGLETMIMNYYRHMNRSKVQFDFLVHREFEADYDQEIRTLGGKIYHLPRLNPFSLTYQREIDSFFKQHASEYQIVHSHLDCMAGIPLKYAKKYDVPVRIAHAHNSNQTKDKKYLLKLLFKKNITRYANHLYACGEEAGHWMFGTDKFTVLNNAIDASIYRYNPEKALKIREELKIADKTLVIGHVGRFAEAKNHRFIVRAFETFLKYETNAKLLLVGDGELRTEIEKMVSVSGIEDSVIFTGVRSDVADLLQAMDVFLFPSIHEGLPVSIVEAQAAGLPCLISDKVPIECKKTNLVYQLKLEDEISVWVKKILEVSKTVRKDTSEAIRTAGFDVCTNAKNLQDFYLGSYDKSLKRGI